jgi:hypothetical protein
MIIGKKNSTLKKQNVTESKLLATGVKSLRFWHEATEGETSIPFGSLNMPADIAACGYVNPTSTEILSANLNLFESNVEVHSYTNGELLEGTYIVKNSQITFKGYVAAEGEIFRVKAKNQVVTGTNIVDARNLTATGVLAAGSVDFAIGEAFQIGQYANSQLGEVLVFVDGKIQHRNVGNATADPGADGNYEEVHATGGYGSAIRFNNAYAEDKPIQVISRGLIAERPDISMLQLIEKLGGQIDKLVEYVAQDIGVDPLLFQTAPNEVDLKAFGDCVYQNKIDIAANTALINTKADEFESLRQTKDLVGGAVADSIDEAQLRFNSLEIGKEYEVHISVRSNSAGVSANAYLSIRHNGNIIVQAGGRSTGGIAVGRLDLGNTGYFTATTTTLITDVFANNSGVIDAANVTLKEIPNGKKTSKWS